MIYTTLNRICPKDSYEGGWNNLLRYLGKYKADDEPLSLATIVKAVGLDDTLYYCRNDPEHAEFVLSKAKEYFSARAKLFADAYTEKYNEIDGSPEEKEVAAESAGCKMRAAAIVLQTIDFLCIVMGAQE
jgi:hypothetical protein